MTRTHIRRGEPADLRALTEIYNHYVERTAVTFDCVPFAIAEREPWFAGFAERGRHQIFVLCEDEAVVAYACSHRFRPKAAYDTSVETSVYCHPDAQGRGYGRQLYEALFDALAGEDVHRIYAGVTLPNPGSVALHERLGFERVAVFNEVGRKLDRYWDVLWLEKRL